MAIPVFVRDGAILPLAEPVDFVGSETVFRLHVEVHGDGRHGCELIEDDGASMAGPTNHIKLTWDHQSLQLQRSGNWAGRRFELIDTHHRE